MTDTAAPERDGRSRPTVRVATIDDAGTIARIRVETWRVAYAGLIDDDLLARLDIDLEGARRRELWEQYHSDPRGAELIAEVDGEPAGWAVAGPSTEDDLAGAGQVFAIYALPQHWGRGVGHALIDAAEDSLRSAGFTRACLWHLDGNARAENFYEAHGWKLDGTTKEDAMLVGGDVARALHERRRQKILG